MRGSVWHIINWPPPTWFYLLSLLYQNRSHKDNQPTGKNPASCNPHLMVRPNSNKALVDSPHRLIIDLYGNHHSYRIHRNKPLFPPVNCSVVKFRGYGHAHRIQCIGTTDKNQKFHHLIKIGVNGLALKMYTCFSAAVKYTWMWSAHFLYGPHFLSLKVIVRSPKICCLRFRSAYLHQDKGMLPAPLQRLFRVGQCLLGCS